MPRKKIIPQNQFPYHIYNRAIDKNFFDVPKDELWELFCDELYSMNLLWGGQLHAAVLMSNHYHLLMSTPESNISQCMQDFQSEFARRISLSKGTDGYRFATRYRWSLIQNEKHFMNVMKYIYLNPVRAGLVNLVEDYSYSSLAGLLGTQCLKIPIHSSPFGAHFFNSEPDTYLSSFNDAFNTLESKAIRSGLRKEVYNPSVSRLSAKSRKLLSETRP